ncbi:MAG: preprotein translocase subunit YajC [Alistipes senegalensis]|nr:preprotein translocase subunit YajC [Alistipes senegalensis]
MFISNAYAQSLSSGLNMDSIGNFLPIILMFVLLYFLMIRPQQRKQKEQKEMVQALAVGDEIITSGGLLGAVAAVGENHIAMETASGARILVQKSAIVGQLPKGTLENLDKGTPESTPEHPDEISEPLK